MMRPVTNMVAMAFIKTQHLSTKFLFLNLDFSGYITTINLENDIKIFSDGERVLKFKLMLNEKKQMKLDFYIIS